MMPVAGMVKKGERLINPYLKGVKEGDELIGMHNLSADNLKHAHEIGGLPVPSIGISKAKHPMEGFGDISLIAKQEMVAPGRGNPVYGADAYSKTYPYIDDNGKIFRGYTYGGKRRYAEHTLDNLVREMKGTVPNTEGFHYGVGSLRSEHAPKLKTMRQIQGLRDKVVSEKEMIEIKKNLNTEFDEIVDELVPYDKNKSNYNNLTHFDVVAERLSPKERLSDYYENVPDELMDKIRKFKNRLKHAPTNYFEAKPQRGVKLQEFSGAVVPEDVPQETLDILKRHGIEDVEKYVGKKGERYIPRSEAIQKFKHLMFGGAGGAVIGERLLRDDKK
jgi:hypothetical protein